MARKLMRLHKLTEAEIWRDEARPTAKSIRVPIIISTNEREAFTTRLVMSRYPKVSICLWTSRVDASRGAMEFKSDDASIDAAADFWKSLHKALGDNLEQAAGRTLAGPVRVSTIAEMMAVLQGLRHLDEWSWLLGATDGFEAEEKAQGHETRAHPEFQPRETAKQIEAPKPKRRRRRLIHKNEFTLAKFDERMLPDYRPPEIQRVALKDYPSVQVYKKDLIKAACSALGVPAEPQPMPPAEAPRVLDKRSYELGWMQGRKTARMWPRKEK